MNDKEDTLIISANEKTNINIGQLEPLDISSVNLDDLIKDIDLSSYDYTMISSGGSGGSYNTTGWPTIQPLTTQQISAMPYSAGNITINNVPTYAWGNSGTSQSTLKVNGDAEIDGDIKWKGRSLGSMLETIERRLSILVPDPEKLAHYEALKKAYEHYKTLEALCETPTKEEDQ